jgi:hypothetical protein
MPERKKSNLMITFVAFLILFNYPILSIVDKRELLLGFPKLYFYLFFVWFSLIADVAFIVLRSRK